MPEVGNGRSIDLSKLKLTALLNKLKSDGYQWETLNKVKILLTDILDRALEDELLIRNPVRGLRNSRNKPFAQIKALSMEDQEAFLECSAGTFYHNFFVAALNTGLRPGEMYALQESNIDFDKKLIFVEHTLIYQKFDGDTGKEFNLDAPKTPTSKRTVPINETCEKLYNPI